MYNACYCAYAVSMVAVDPEYTIGNNNMKMAAGLSKLFRPAAPSTVKRGPSKARVRKGGKGACEESVSDTSSVRVKGSDVMSDDQNINSTTANKTDGQKYDSKTSPPMQWAYKQDCEVIPPEFRNDIQIAANSYAEERAGPSQQGADSKPNGAVQESEWTQLPGSIPDPEEDVVKQKTPPAEKKSKRAILDGQAIEPQDIENVPQPSKKYVRDVRTRRVMKEYRAVVKLCDLPNSIFSVDLVEDNLFEWNIKLFEVDPLSLLHYDMEKRDIPFILFNLSFPDNFPFNPPFVRVVSPKIENGYVMDGGAICMELLTPGGWSSAYTVEAIVMQLGATLVAGHARLSKGKRYRIFGDVPFNKQEAVDSFRNIVETHKRYGWHTPAGEFS